MRIWWISQPTAAHKRDRAEESISSYPEATSPEACPRRGRIAVQTAEVKGLALACKEAGVFEQSYHRCRKEYGGLQVDKARKTKDREHENASLRQIEADLCLKN